jgi:nicotinamidase-related amidase
LEPQAWSVKAFVVEIPDFALEYNQLTYDPTMNYTRPDFGSVALITIDVQNDFLKDQPCEILGTSEMLPAMRELAEIFRRARLPVIHMVRLYKSDGSNAELCRRSAIEKGASIVRPGTSGAQLAQPLLPVADAKLDDELLLSGALQSLGPNEWAIYKPRWGAFFGTSLGPHLKNLGATTLAFAGCNFPNCPRASIYEASERDFRIILVEDAISGLYDRGLEEMKNIGVTIMTKNQVAQSISRCGKGADEGVNF